MGFIYYGTTSDVSVFQAPSSPTFIVTCLGSTVTSGSTTISNTPKFSGTGINNSIITIYGNGNLLGTTTIMNDSWSFTTSALSNASYAFTLTITSSITHLTSNPTTAFNLNINWSPNYGVDQYTKLMLHGETLTDNSLTPHTFQAFSGSRSINTVSQKIGTGCIQNNGGWYTTTNSDLLLQSDFTVEMWANWYDGAASTVLFMVTNCYAFYWYPDGRLIFDYYGARVQYGWTPTINTWYHIAAVNTVNPVT